MSAYNPTTGELVVQFMPILEDRYDQVNIKYHSTTKDPAFYQYPNYQQWFFDKLLELNTFVNQNARPLPGCKRRIFALFLENSELKRSIDSMPNWSKDNAPLFFLRIQYTGSDSKSQSLTGINIFFHSNCENLGFNLYGNAEVLYGLERFFTEYVTYFDETYDNKSQARTLDPCTRSLPMDLLGGEWFKSKSSSVASEKKFGQKWNEFIYKTVDLYDDQDLFKKVRTSYYRDRIQKEGKGQLERVRSWSKAQRYAENVKFDAHSHRCQLVFKPVSRANKFDAADWTERAVDFGLDALTKKQQSALIVYNNDLKRMFEASDFAFFARQSTRLGVEINRYVMPKLLKKVRVDHSSLEMGTSRVRLKEEVKTVFLKGFKSRNIQHPLFDSGRTEAKRLMITKRGLQELKTYDRKLYRLTSRYVDENKLTASEFGKQIDRWVGHLKVRTGDTKTSFRQPGRVIHSITKVGSIGRPLEVIHMDLADVNRLNPDKQRYRYPFILVALDAFSNYTVLVPVKNKSADSILNAVKNAFNQFGISKKTSTSSYLRREYKKKSKRSVMDDEDEERAKRWCLVTTKIQADRGSEFVNETLRAFLKRRRVELFSSRGSTKALNANKERVGHE